MKTTAFKNCRVVRSSWLEEGGRRLDCNPYMSGALEARDALRKLTVVKDALKSLTAGAKGGIYNGPMFSRKWVDDRNFGVPFLSNSEMLSADLFHLPLLKKEYAKSPYLAHLELQPHTTLISCSGTIGRMSYVRPDMAGVWSSQHIMKVVPNEDLISPGYLYAFLSSKYGVPLVVSGTYGAIIQHIEPEHIANLPVPRLGEAFEKKVANRIDGAAIERSIASSKRQEAINLFQRSIEWVSPSSRLQANSVPSSALARRMDAFHHSIFVRSGKNALSTHSCIRLADLVESVFEPNRGPRLKVSDTSYGVPFLSSSSVFELNPIGDYSVSLRRTPNIEELLLSACDLLLPRSGQIGGIIGRAVLPIARNIGSAGSEHLVRVRCKSESDAAYLWAALASEPGYRAVIGTAFGSSIPSLDAFLIGELSVPWLELETRDKISTLVREALASQGKGAFLELEAVAMLEEKISEGA